jgi:hypothetical protein
MNYWLVKFAPFRYSWQDVLGAGAVSVGLGYSLALLDVGIGAGLVGMVLSP